MYLLDMSSVTLSLSHNKAMHWRTRYMLLMRRNFERASVFSMFKVKTKRKRHVYDL